MLAAVDMRKREQRCATAAEIRSSCQMMSIDEVIKQGRDPALVEVALGKRRKVRTGFVPRFSPAFLPRPRASKTVDLPSSTLDNLGFDCSTT
jgi:hypothetical protein